jgi:hypothetical protein
VPGARHHPVAFAFALAAVAFGARTALASAVDAEAPGSPPRASIITHEIIGLELTPVSLSLGDVPRDRPGELDRFQLGMGGNLRLFRRRWAPVYVIPLQLGLYLSGTGPTTFAHVQTEGGLIVPGTNGRLEVGMGVGLGVLTIAYSQYCDGPCNVGGIGLMVSFAARYLFHASLTNTVGVGLRAVIPADETRRRVFGELTNRGEIILGSLEIGFGHL